MLTLHELHAHYGKSHVLHGVSFGVGTGADGGVGQGEIVALLGRNGSGRSTTAKAIMGLVACHGSVLWRGQQVVGKKPFELAQLGLGYVPESRDVFPQLTVQENLLLGQRSAQPKPSARWQLHDTYRLFPSLKAREHTRAGVLSGGEQQMLALCRTLMGDPDLIVVDEPTEGLAPQLVEQVGACLLALKERGVSVLLIEQKLSIALAISSRVLVMGRGRIVFEGTPEELRANTAACQEWLGV